MAATAMAGRAAGAMDLHLREGKLRAADHHGPAAPGGGRRDPSPGHGALAAVSGIPHDDWGEGVKAVVEPVPDADPGPGLTAELLEFLSGRVAKFKLPRTIDYVAELPRDPNGKLYKRRLADPYRAGPRRI